MCYYRYANQNNEYSYKPIRMLHTKTLAIPNAEKPEFSLITSGNENWYRYFGRYFDNFLQR